MNSTQWWMWLDGLAHRHGKLLPRRLRNWICNKLDRAIGVTDGDHWNGPR